MQQPQTIISSFYQRRKHKLLRALTNLAVGPRECQHPRQHLIALYETCSNKDNHVSQIDYFIKHEFDCELEGFTGCLMEVVWELVRTRSGSIAGFVAYRLARKYPQLYWPVYEASYQHIMNVNWTLDEVSFFTDLFLYGFPFTLQDFATKIFPHFKLHTIDLIPKYLCELESSLTFPLKLQKMFKANCLGWVEQEKMKIISQYEELKDTSSKIQDKLVSENEDEAEMNLYQSQLEKYETLLHRFDGVAVLMGIEFAPSAYKLKTIFELRKECQTFRTSFELTPYEESLYFRSSGLQEIKPLKKHEMLKLQESEAFINQIKLCSNVEECLNLGGYFLEQMNLQKNRDYLIETIINECFHYNNISYILKIVFEVSQLEGSLREYCQAKAKKICSTNKMNPKYQKLMCEMARFSLIDEHILLDYCDRVLKNENPTTIREVQSILEQLGTIIYYRSLQSHIRINNLFERIEGIIKGRLVQFSTQHLYQLKGVMNFLQNQTNSMRQPQSRFMSEFEIKENFDFILTKMQKLMKEGDNQQVIEYLVVGIDHEEYLTSYYYASLLRELNSPQMERDMHQITKMNILDNVDRQNYQQAVIWSRFLGELYNYECISRQELLADLAELLKVAEEKMTVAGSLKCICSALETSKTYLQSNNLKRQKQMVLFLLHTKIVFLRHTNQLQYTLCCEYQDIVSFFNPNLVFTLNFVEDIECFLRMLEGQDRLTISINSYLARLAEGSTLEQLKASENGAETKKKYKEKQSIQRTQRRWIEKETVVRAKVEQKDITAVSEFRVVPQGESMGKESVNTIESSECKKVKKMKFIGRSKKDNKVTSISCSITERI